MKTPLKNLDNIKKSSNLSKMKQLFLSLSPQIQKVNELNKSSFKNLKLSNYSFYPRINTYKNSFLFKNNNKRNSTDSSYSNNLKRSIIYNKKFIHKNNNNILLALRIKPFNEKEKLISPETIIKIENKNTLIIKDKNEIINSNNNKSYRKIEFFNYIFNGHENQKEVFNLTLKNSVKDLINGKNITILTYGASGSGKTYTILGTRKNPGIIPNTLSMIFDLIKLNKNPEYNIKISYFEIYEEKINDLLLKENIDKNEKINGLTMKQIDENDDIISIIKNCDNNYQKGHKILQILVNHKGKKIDLSGKINFIELKGIERMNILDKGRNNSKIEIKDTLPNFGYFLQYLTGFSTRKIRGSSTIKDNELISNPIEEFLRINSKIIFIANISSYISDYDETLKTLKFTEIIKETNNSNYNSINFKDNNINVINNIHSENKSIKDILGNYNIKNDSIKKKKSRSTINYQESFNKVKYTEDNKDGYNKKNENKDMDIIDVIKGKNLAFETFNLKNYINEKGDKNMNPLIDDFVQQSQAEVKLKEKIMGIYYDIYLINNLIREKIAKKQNISYDKKKLKSYQKILNKNIICLNDISHKNQNILNKYLKKDDFDCPKKDGNIYENDNYTLNEKNELDEWQRKYIFIVEKLSKLQEENIEIKYNYILIQEELYKKDKIIQDLQKKIELRDLNIKETFSLDKENSINKELDYKYKILLSEQEKSKTLRETNKTIQELELDEPIFENENDLNRNLRLTFSNGRKKHYSFHPRNTSQLKSYTISNYLKCKKSGTPIKDFLIPKKLETNTEIKNTMDDYYFDDKLNIFNNNNYYLNEEQKIIGKEFNELLENFNIEEKTLINFSLKNNFSKNVDDLINEDEGNEDTNNKTLKSVLNDIQTMNSNINNRLSIIEKKTKTIGRSVIIKPISKTISNNIKMADLFDNNKVKENNKLKTILKYDYKEKNNINKPFTEKKKKKRKIKNSSIKLNYFSSPNDIELKLTKNTHNHKQSEILTKKNSIEMTSPNLIISVNLKTKNKKLVVNSPLESHFQRNMISNLKNEKNKNKETHRNINLITKNIIEKDRTKKKIKETKENPKKTKQTNHNNKTIKINHSFNKDKNPKKLNDNEIKVSNQTKGKLIDSKMKNEEKLKLQLFYLQHLNKYKTNNSKINIKNNNTFNNNVNLSKNNKNSILYNDNNNIVDIKN